MKRKGNNMEDYYKEGERRRVLNRAAREWHELPEEQKTGNAGAVHFLRIVGDRDARIRHINAKYSYGKGE